MPIVFLPVHQPDSGSGLSSGSRMAAKGIGGIVVGTRGRSEQVSDEGLGAGLAIGSATRPLIGCSAPGHTDGRKLRAGEHGGTAGHPPNRAGHPPAMREQQKITQTLPK